MLEGEHVDAVVVGGGPVATRKVMALLDSGARVRVVAPRVDAALKEVASRERRLTIEERGYRAGGEDIGSALLVFAATDDRNVNAQVASDARRAHRLANVADVPGDGSFVTVATHRAGPLVVGVAAGVPGAAARIRDAIASRFDVRYADALSALGALRREMLDQRAAADEWRAAERELTGPDFCARVEDGRFTTARNKAAPERSACP
jgi:siroheme synthase-like protein